jgi:hypothetical protein
MSELAEISKKQPRGKPFPKGMSGAEPFDAMKKAGRRLVAEQASKRA